MLRKNFLHYMISKIHDIRKKIFFFCLFLLIFICIFLYINVLLMHISCENEHKLYGCASIDVCVIRYLNLIIFLDQINLLTLCGFSNLQCGWLLTALLAYIELTKKFNVISLSKRGI